MLGFGLPVGNLCKLLVHISISPEEAKNRAPWLNDDNIDLVQMENSLLHGMKEESSVVRE